MDTFTIRKRALAERLKEKLSDKLHDLPEGLSHGLPQDPKHRPQRHVEKGAARVVERSRAAEEPARERARTLLGMDDDGDPLLEFLARYDEGASVDEGAGVVPAAPTDDEKRFLSFELAGEEYAASIMDIREILKAPALTEVPRAPAEILGVLSKRGVVMPVIDLAASIGLRPPEPSGWPEQRILVVGEGDRVCGLRVDRVREVVRLSKAHIEDVPPSLGARQAHMLTGLGRAGDRMLILLDVVQVLDGLAAQMGLPTLAELQGDRQGAEAR